MESKNKKCLLQLQYFNTIRLLIDSTNNLFIGLPKGLALLSVIDGNNSSGVNEV
jgi:ligand-binding sensor domain-containing protein